MNREKRDQTIRVFMAKENAQIMLMSLKCGGVGLSRLHPFCFHRFTLGSA
jgi:SNF2 family DNA or RNA helicase